MLNRRHIPNLLTFARVFAVPLCLGFMLLDPKPEVALLWIFVAASLTDFLDGYLARRWQVVSPLGTMLDPVADKLLVALMLLYLLVEGGITPPSPPAAARFAFGYAPPAMLLFFPIAVILLRELYIAGLREFLATRQIALPVSKGGKWKTALQMVAITLLLAQMAYAIPAAPLYCAAPFAAAFSAACSGTTPPLADLAGGLGLPLLYAAAFLAFTSAASYTRAALKHGTLSAR